MCWFFPPSRTPSSDVATAVSVGVSPSSSGGSLPQLQSSLFPCLVCYPGTNNYSLVWVPIDSNTASALNSALLLPQTLPSTPLPAASQSPASSIPASTTVAAPTSPAISASASLSTLPSTPQPAPSTSQQAQQACATPSTAAQTVAAAAAGAAMPQIPASLSAVITQNYIQQLLQLQIQQQALAQLKSEIATTSSVNPLLGSVVSGPLSSLLTLPSVGSLTTSTGDILTQVKETQGKGDERMGEIIFEACATANK